jgi:hypothetical protein
MKKRNISSEDNIEDDNLNSRANFRKTSNGQPEEPKISVQAALKLRISTYYIL